MRVAKKVISVVLISTILISTCSITTFAWSWPWEGNAEVDVCELKNSDGGYKNFDCVNSKGKEAVRSGSSYVFFDKIGHNAELELHVFELSRASEILNNLKPIPDKVFWEAKCSNENTKSNIAAVVAGSIGAGLAGLLAKYYNKKGAEWINSKTNLECRPLSFWESIEAVGCIAVASALLVKTFVAFHFAGIRSTESHNEVIKISNYKSILEQLSDFLRYDAWKNRDAVSIKFNKDPQHHSASVSFLNLGRNYTDVEKEQYITNLKASVEAAKIDLLNRRNQWEK